MSSGILHLGHEHYEDCLLLVCVLYQAFRKIQKKRFNNKTLTNTQKQLLTPFIAFYVKCDISPVQELKGTLLSTRILLQPKKTTLY